MEAALWQCHDSAHRTRFVRNAQLIIMFRPRSVNFARTARRAQHVTVQCNGVQWQRGEPVGTALHRLSRINVLITTLSWIEVCEAEKYTLTSGALYHYMAGLQ